MGLSESTIEVLKGAKRGKACRFVLLYKGTTPLQLVAYRKGSVEKYAKEAKEAGPGQIAAGVLSGEGEELRLQLSRAEGYDKAPVTTMALRNFLNEAGFKCKPLLEVVDSLGPVLDEDDPLVRRFLELRNAALAAADLRPDRAAEINQACLTLGQLLEQDSSAPAVAPALAALERLVAAPGDSVAPPPGSPVTPPNAADELERFKTRFADLIKAATPLVAQIGDRLKQLGAEAKGLAGKADWPAAHASLDQLAELVNQTIRAAELRRATGVEIPLDAPTLSPVEQASAHAGPESLRERLTRLERTLLSRNQASLTGELPTIGRLLDKATEDSLAGAARELSRVEAASDQLALEAELTEGDADYGRPKGVVVYQKSRLAWDGVLKRAQAEIDRFKQAATEEMKLDPAMAAQLDCLGRLDDLLRDAAEGIADALDEAAKATVPAASRRAHQSARELIRRRIDEIGLSEEFELLTDNEISPSSVRQLLVEALSTLDKAMGS